MKMKTKTVLLIFIVLIVGCNSIETPEPVYHKGYERLTTQYIDWPIDCSLPEQIFIIEDESGAKGFPKCKIKTPFIDYTKWNVVMYNEGWYNGITEMNVGSHWYINHELKTVRFEIVTRVTWNPSGLSSNGFSKAALHAVMIPKIPKDYTIEITYG